MERALPGVDADFSSSKILGTNYKGKRIEEEQITESFGIAGFVSSSSGELKTHRHVKSEDKSWVVAMSRKLTQGIHEQKDNDRGPYIFRVPEWIKNMTNKEAYQPWVVSLGPYHHGDTKLIYMEQHKRHAVLEVAKQMEVENALGQLASVVNDLEDFLLRAYDGIHGTWWEQNKDRFKEIMLMDGCFLLEVIRVYGLLKNHQRCDSYRYDDPVFSERGFGYLYLAIKCDLIVLENQIPLYLLEKLQEKIYGHAMSKTSINNMVLEFLGCEGNSKIEDQLALHPLDLLHRRFCGKEVQSDGWTDSDGTVPTVTELVEAGIRFEKSTTPYGVKAIEFNNGVLSMPVIEVNDRTEKEFLNLMAFERLYGSAGSDATSFMIFMDNIVDTERDVALLKSKGLIRNMLSSDKEATKLFNTLGKGAVLQSPSAHLYFLRRMVNEHCQKKWNKWRANFLQTYVRNPWVFSAFVASVFLLIFTLLQTVYAIITFHKNKS